MDFLTKFNINITNKDLLKEALSHSSYANEDNKRTSYERLEFLGDSILSAIISEYFYINTSFNEGEMSKKRASYVCEQALAYYAKSINLDKNIKLGKVQKGNLTESIIADVFEALIAVIFIEKGYYTTKKFIYKTVIPSIKENKLFFSDYKSALQELIHLNHDIVIYKTYEVADKNNEPIFKAEAIVNNIIYGVGCGKSKKEAEQEAAKNAVGKKVK